MKPELPSGPAGNNPNRYDRSCGKTANPRSLATNFSENPVTIVPVSLMHTPKITSNPAPGSDASRPFACSVPTLGTLFLAPGFDLRVDAGRSVRANLPAFSRQSFRTK